MINKSQEVILLNTFVSCVVFVLTEIAHQSISVLTVIYFSAGAIQSALFASFVVLSLIKNV